MAKELEPGYYFVKLHGDTEWSVARKTSRDNYWTVLGDDLPYSIIHFSKIGDRIKEPDSV
jgi:hypothetical protein